MNKIILLFFHILITFALVMDTQTLANESTDVKLATLGIQANWQFTVKIMGKTARVYLRGKDEFMEIPRFLQGLQYTLGRKNKMTTISCRVKTSGRIYLSLFGDKTPKSIGLPQTWEKAGSMQGPGFQGKTQWTIYQTDVQKGDILTFLRDDPMGGTVIAGKFTRDKNRPLPKIPKTKNAERHQAGKSVKNRPITYLVFGEGDDVTFILATIHGDEYVGTLLVHRLAEYLDTHPEVLQGRKVVLLPNANPDGTAGFRHFNANGINLNRNFKTKNRRNGKRNGQSALSEPEARVIHDIIEKYSPDRVVTLHQLRSWNTQSKRPPGMVDYEGPAEELAKRMSNHCTLPVERFGTQHGSMGAYVGDDLNIPIITLEMPKYDYGLTVEQLWDKYGNALLETIVYPETVQQ